ncbi:hypothetical protein Moror_17473 [Moniliophthora roreri MCA 2997]|uniref:F-box domain-containing protein n=1 Tax=Moniliophthora roreri (strain MCA 2997) TaxID=1381753 RepID=V2XXN2_MONRO|nr:hypothetical protein Moror_17473 [Moniliophthora roreri MCA 2997]KAI3612598.1 hypothetical protein WG66_009850 [Moniliophthora roreri]
METNPVASFFVLPHEVICLILAQLDPASIARCTQVCQRLNSITRESHLYDYKKTLALANLVDESFEDHPEAGAQTRLRRLEAHQAAWKGFKWIDTEKYPLARVRLWEIIGGVLCLYDHEDGGFTSTRIPSVHRGIERTKWRIPESGRFGDHPEDFTIDPSRDLLMVLHKHVSGNTFSFELQPLSLETGRNHPNASSTPLRKDVEAESYTEWTYDMRIFEQFIGVLCISGESASSLLVWNWETGDFVKAVEEPMSFSFLNERFIVYSAEKYDPDQQGMLPTLILLDLDPSGRCGEMHLELPVVDDSVEVLHISVHTESPPGSRSSHLSQAPFRTDFHDRLFVVCIRMQDYRQNVMHNFSLFIMLSAFLPYMEEMEGSSKELVEHPWGDWGPENSKLLHVDFPDAWACFVYGLRAVVMKPRPESAPEFPKQFHLFDFNQASIRPGVNDGSNAQVSTKTVTRDNGFRFPVASALPCRIIEGTLPEAASAIMLNEDALVTISGDESDMTIYSF